MAASAGCTRASTMHGSISASYLLPTTDKKDLLQPKVLQPDGGELLLLQGAAAGAGDDGVSPLGRFRMYNCPGHCVTVAMEARAVCPHCRRAMAMEMTFVPPSAAPKAGVGKGGGGAAGAAPAEERGGYVKDVVTYMVTYMVTDGLEVTPMSGISSIALINRFSIGKGDVDLAEKFVTVGMDEVRSCIAPDGFPPNNH